MCNAWNHHQPCNCGWGQGLGGKWDRSINPLHPVIGHFRSTAGYVNPNAICPVCHSQVFFVQCENGGRVFFDELGPPWPKHPCTDNGAVPRKTNHQSVPGKDPRWREAEWTPFLVDGIAKRHDVSEVSGVVNGVRVNLFLPYTQKHLDALFQIRVPSGAVLDSISSPDEYQISMLVLTDEVRVIETKGFVTESAAERARISAINTQRFKASDRAKKARSGRYSSQHFEAKADNAKHRNVKLKKDRELTTWKDPDSSTPGAIELAFINAGMKKVK